MQLSAKQQVLGKSAGKTKFAHLDLNSSANTADVRPPPLISTALVDQPEPSALENGFVEPMMDTDTHEFVDEVANAEIAGPPPDESSLLRSLRLQDRFKSALNARYSGNVTLSTDIESDSEDEGEDDADVLVPLNDAPCEDLEDEDSEGDPLEGNFDAGRIPAKWDVGPEEFLKKVAELGMTFH